MHNKPRVLLIVLIVIYLALVLAFFALHLFVLQVMLLISIAYLALAILAYKEFYSIENQKNLAKALQFLDQNYSEVTPIHPKLFAFKHHMLHEGNIKVYAKVCYGYMLNVKIVSKKSAYKISGYDWNWFFANFKEKESN